MRIATYNVHHGAPANGPVDLDAILQACRALDADVLAIQELDSVVRRSGHVDQPEVLAAALGRQAVFAPTVRMGERGRYGHALLAADGLADIRLVELTVTSGREPRTAVLATTSIDRTPVEVVALHLENPRRADGPSPIALEQAAVAFGLVAARADASGRPAVLLGDLNLSAEAALPIADSHGFDLAGGPATFPAIRPRQRIDHIAVRGLTIEWVEVPASDASDHRPLLVVAESSSRPGA